MNVNTPTTLIDAWFNYSYQLISIPMESLLQWSFALLLLMITLGRGLSTLVQQDQHREVPYNPFNPYLTQGGILLLLLILTPLIRPLASQLIILMADGITLYFNWLGQLGGAKRIIQYLLLFIPLAIALSEFLLREFDKMSDKMVLSFMDTAWSKALIGTIFILPVGQLIATAIPFIIAHFGVMLVLSLI